MKVQWMKYAIKSLDQIYFYLKDKDAPRAARKITIQIWETANKLAKHSNMGKIEPDLNAEEDIYRSLIVGKNYKIIYYYEDKTVYIIDIWDVRQDPSKFGDIIRKL